MKKSYKLLILITIFALVIFYNNVDDRVEFIENLSIPIGIGYDIKLKTDGDIIYSVPTNVYLFESNGTSTSKVVMAEGNTLLETRGNRQDKLGKKFFIGLEKVYLFGDELAQYGLRDVIEGVFNEPLISDMGYGVVCKGKAESILKYPIKGYISSAEFIEGLIKNLKYGNFFGKDFKMSDVFLKMSSEGRKTILPYIEIKDNTIAVTGVAIFKQDKMVLKMNMKDTRMLNLLTEDNVQGTISVKDNANDYVSTIVLSKRKVDCIKKDDNYKFIINLNLKTDICYDRSKTPVYENRKNEEIFKKKLSQQVENEAADFIKKMQSVYKLDLLDLGRAAAAKYGRRKGVDWDKIVSDSQIDVKVNVKVDRVGRGKF